MRTPRPVTIAHNSVKKEGSRQNHFPIGRHMDTLTLKPPSHIIKSN